MVQLRRYFFFFLMPKIWVGRTTLNDEKKEDGLNTASEWFFVLLLVPFVSRSMTPVPRSLLLNRRETLATQANVHTFH